MNKQATEQSGTNRFYQYWLLMRFHKPIGIFLVLWPTLWGLWIAGAGRPQLKILLVFIAGTVCMRAAGCVINDIADRRFDPQVSRTAERPLAAGKISVQEAWILLGFLLAAALGLVLLLNRLTILLSIVGALLALIYPWLKRVTHLPQVWLGMAFSWGIPMAFAAQTQTVPPRAWALFAIALIWPVIYDTFYALVDKAEDVLIGVKSTAILFGRYVRVVVAGLQILFWLALILYGFKLGFGLEYFLALIVALGLMLYQQYLIRGLQREACFKAFLNNNWVGLVIFLGLVLSDLN